MKGIFILLQQKAQILHFSENAASDAKADINLWSYAVEQEVLKICTQMGLRNVTTGVNAESADAHLMFTI